MRSILAALLLLSTGCAHAGLQVWTVPPEPSQVPELPVVERPAGDCDQAHGLAPGDAAPCGGVLLPTDLAEVARVALELDPEHRAEAVRMHLGRVADRKGCQGVVTDLARENSKANAARVRDVVLTGIVIGIVGAICGAAAGGAAAAR